MIKRLMALLSVLSLSTFAAPVVEIKSVVQNPPADGLHGLVVITYDLTDPDDEVFSVELTVENGQGGFPVSSVSGDIGEGVEPGLNRVVTWDPNVDWPDEQGELTFNLTANYSSDPGEYALGFQGTGSFSGDRMTVDIYKNGSKIKQLSYSEQNDGGNWMDFADLQTIGSVGDVIRVRVSVVDVTLCMFDVLVTMSIPDTGEGYYLPFSNYNDPFDRYDGVGDPETVTPYTGTIYNDSLTIGLIGNTDTVTDSFSIAVGDNGPGTPLVNRVESLEVTDAEATVFVEGAVDIQLFTADVDWAGNAAGTIAFYKAYKTVTGDYRASKMLQFSSSPTLTYNIGQLEAGEGIYAQAISSGQSTSPVWANFSVVSAIIKDIVFESSVVRYGRHTLFLEGVGFDQTFSADVDWGGNEPGSISFYKGLRDVCMASNPDVLIQSGTETEMSIDVGTLPVGYGIYVVAESASGVKSEKIWADFDVIPLPLKLDASEIYAKESNGNLKYRAFDQQIMAVSEGVDQISAEVDGAESGEKVQIPFFSNNPFKYHLAVESGFEITPDGKGRNSVCDAKGVGFKAGQFELMPEIHSSVTFTYDQSLKKWVYGGYLKEELAIDLPPVDFYTPYEGLLEVKVGFSAEGGVHRHVLGWNEEDEWQYDGVFHAGIGGKFVGGLGDDDIAGIFVWIKLMGMIDLGFTQDPVLRYLGLEFAIGDKEVLGWLVLEHQWGDDFSIPIVDNRLHEQTDSVAARLTMADVGTATFEPLPRAGSLSRLNDLKESGASISRSAGSEPAVSGDLSLGSVVMSISSPSPVFPQTNVFQYVQTAFDASASNACYLWNIDDPARSSENRTVLKYSFDEGTAWSAPATVWDDGTADYNPDVQLLSDGSAYALWSNGKTALPAGAGPAELLEGLEVAFARYVPGSGWTCSNLTDNAVLDQSPKIAAADDGTAWALWIRNGANNYKGSSSEPNTLMARFYDGADWAPEIVVATNLGMIASGSLTQIGSNTVYTCSLHSDDNYYTTDDTEIYQAVCSAGIWNDLTRLTDNDVRDISVRLETTADGAPVAAWVQGDNLQLARNSDFSSPQTVMSTTSEPMAAYFDLLCGASNQIGMVWSSASAGGQDAFMINYDPVLSAWSQPIQLTDTDAAERFFDGNYDPVDGTLNLAFVQSELLSPTNAAPEYGVTDVCLMDFNSGVDLRVIDFTYDADQMLPGSNTVLSATIDNAGLSGAADVNIAFYDGDPSAGGLLIGQTNVAEFAAGLSVLFEQDWSVPLDGAAHQLYIAADYGQSVDDQNRGNNSQSISVLSSELQIDSFAVFNTSNDVWRLDVSLASDGYSACSNSITLEFFYPDETGALVAQTNRTVAVESGAVELISVSFVDAGIFTNATETLSAVLCCGGDTSVVDRVSAQFETALDSDSDSVSDADELRFGTDPNLLDSDGDGLDDRFELLQFESSALSADTDGDGVNDYSEFVAGTSSTNASAFFAMRFENGLVRCPTESGRSYTLETTGDLSGDWNVVSNFYGTGEWVDLDAGIGTNQLFYRIRVWKPE